MTSKQHAILFVWLLAVFSSASSVEADEAVTYEAFGAVGENRMLPILARPGNPMIIGRIEDESVLKDFLRGVVIKEEPKEEEDVWAEDADETLE